MKPVIICLLVFFALPALAADWKEIEGIYAVTAEGYLDPASDEQKDSHYRFQLRGNSAKDMYAAMKVVPVRDECTGALAKNIKEMKCLFYESTPTYECHFSIVLQSQEITYGVAC